MQTGVGLLNPDLRHGASTARISIGLEGINTARHWGLQYGAGALQIEIQNSNIRFKLSTSSTNLTVPPFPALEPNHYIVPYLSKRKAVAFDENVRESNALSVGPQFNFLAAKLSRLGNPSFPAHEQYAKTCKEILGFVVTAVPSANGQRPGTYISSTDTIGIEQMGEGVPNIVGLLADLALYNDKLFLVEEPENDLHPAALKALLELMLESSKRNQFVVSTHSNIVLRYLGATPKSHVYRVDVERGVMPPEARIASVPSTPEARLKVLRELGYTFSDFELFDGWLILEESSAERIIRDYLIPWFTPKLTRIRTLAAGGNSEVEPIFDDFNRLVRFTHLEATYRNSVWVLIDGDDEGHRIIARLRERYSTWNVDRFRCLNEKQFERYFPRRFTDRVENIFKITNKQERREAKRILLDEVRMWLDANEVPGRAELAESAAPVIEVLQQIQAQLFQTG